MLFVVGDQVIHGESVVAGDEIDGGRGSAPAVEILGALDAAVELGGAGGITLDEPAQAVPVFSVPFRPAVPGGKITHLIEAARVPGFRDQFGAAQDSVVGQGVDERGIHHGIAFLIPGQDGCQIEAEAVDMIGGYPVAQAVQDVIADDRLVAVHRVSAAAVIHVSSVRRQQVISPVVDPLIGDDRSVLAALRCMVENNIENDGNAVLMQLFDHVFELIRFHAQRTRGGVARLGREKAQRRVAPVIEAQAAVFFPAVFKFIKGENGHELDTVDPQGFEIGDFLNNARIGPPVFDPAGGVFGKTSYMHLIDDEVLHGEFQGLVALPVIILMDDLSAVNVGRSRFSALSPDAPPGNRFRVGVQDHPALVKAQPSRRVVDAVKPVTVLGGLDRNAEHHHCIDIADPELLRKRYFRKGLLFTAAVEHQSAGDRLLGKNAEIDDVVLDKTGAERQHPADPVLKALVFVCGKSVDQFHSLSSKAGAYRRADISDEKNAGEARMGS